MKDVVEYDANELERSLCLSTSDFRKALVRRVAVAGGGVCNVRIDVRLTIVGRFVSDHFYNATNVMFA